MYRNKFINPIVQNNRHETEFIIEDYDTNQILLREWIKFRPHASDQAITNEGNKKLKAWLEANGLPEENAQETIIHRAFNDHG